MLRSVAVLSVMVDHLISTLISHEFNVNSLVRTFTVHIGQAGVLAFFVHTSLVLMYSLERLSEVYSNRVWLTVNFYIRRFFRIYPLAWFIIAFVLIFGVPATTWGKVPEINASVVVCNLLLIQNICTGQSILGPLWSLPYEIQMYLFLPMLFLLARSRFGLPLVGMLLVLLCGIGFAVGALAGGRMNVFAYFPCFLSGVMAYAIGLRVNPLLPHWGWPLLVLFIFSVYAVSNSSFEKPVYWIGWLFCVVIGLSVNGFRDGQIRILNSAYEWIAKYSNGMYLFHVPVLYFLYDIMSFSNTFFGIFLYFILTALFSVFAYKVIQKPFVDFGKSISARPAWSLSMRRR